MKNHVPHETGKESGPVALKPHTVGRVAGRPPIACQTATGHVHIRTMLPRKSAWVRAAKPNSATKILDAAADYHPCRVCGTPLVRAQGNLRALREVITAMKYHIKEFRPGRWHVVDETGQPLYDSERDGNDRPLIFTDPDSAQQCADKMTADKTKEQEVC